MAFNPWAQELADTREHALIRRTPRCEMCGWRVRDQYGRFTTGRRCWHCRDLEDPLEPYNRAIRVFRGQSA